MARWCSSTGAERGNSIIKELGDRVTFVEGSVLSEWDVEHAVELAVEVGRLSTLVNCADGARASSRIVGRDGSPHHYGLFTETVALNL